MISHYLITRFNIRVPEWRTCDKGGLRTLTDDWMSHRFKLFDKHTVPSVEAQTNQDFLWMVLFDETTSTRWRERVADYNCQPIYVTDYLRDLQFIIQGGPTPWTVTTRLDNDDAIHPEFIATIQAAAKPTTEFLNIPNGWYGSKPHHHRANPFMSFVERTELARTIYFTAHGIAMAEHAPIRQISNKRLWTQIIHERNYRNV